MFGAAVFLQQNTNFVNQAFKRTGLNKYKTQIFTLCMSVGVPQWTVRVMSVVPSLVWRETRCKMSHPKHSVCQQERAVTHRYWPPESTRYISSTVSFRLDSLVGLKQQNRKRCNQFLNAGVWVNERKPLHNPCWSLIHSCIHAYYLFKY